MTKEQPCKRIRSELQKTKPTPPAVEEDDSNPEIEEKCEGMLCTTRLNSVHLRIGKGTHEKIEII